MHFFDHVESYPYLYALDGGEVASVLVTVITNLCLIGGIKPLEFRNQMQSIVLQYNDLYEEFVNK